MNQRGDSWKKNLLAIAAKPQICRKCWFLSHTTRRNATEGRMDRAELRGFSAYPWRAAVRSTCVQPIRVSRRAASAETAHPARTKGVRAAASTGPGQAGMRRCLRRSGRWRAGFERNAKTAISPAATAICLRTRRSAGLFPICNARSPSFSCVRRC